MKVGLFSDEFNIPAYSLLSLSSVLIFHNYWVGVSESRLRISQARLPISSGLHLTYQFYQNLLIIVLQKRLITSCLLASTRCCLRVTTVSAGQIVSKQQLIPDELQFARTCKLPSPLSFPSEEIGQIRHSKLVLVLCFHG